MIEFAVRKICTAFNDETISELSLCRKADRKVCSWERGDVDEPRPARPCILNDDKLIEVVELDSYQTCQEIAKVFSVKKKPFALSYNDLGRRGS